MSVVFSGTYQGSFTSTGLAKTLILRSDVDYLWVYNQSSIATPTGSHGAYFYWQRGMASGTGFEWQYNAGATAVDLVWLTSGGFSLYNNTVNQPGPSVAITAISNGAVPPVVSTGSTANLAAGSVVRLFNVAAAHQLDSLDFTIGSVVTNTSFTLAYMSALPVAGTTGAYRIIPYDPYFYPPHRTITKIEASTFNGFPSAIVTLSVTHNYTIGQAISFRIPTVTAAAFGMPQLDRVQANIIDIGQADADGITNTITVALDVSTFGTFTWPLSANVPFTPAQIVPVGENTGVANFNGVNPFLDAEINEGQIGITLQPGVNGPGGESADVLYWVAGKSFNT